ncbi:MAG: hypothetical protein EOP05_10340 [Proteobacteria bacterium]|nr:MAG: hypothetical protein EOP05_10340 [Pseudomonadota bacterium]
MRDLSLRRAAYSSFGFFVLSLATLSVASANVVGAGTQNFNPTTSGLDFVTVQSSKTLKPGVFNLGFFGNYAVNSLPYFEGGNQSRSEFNDTLTSTDLSIGLGLTSRWDVGLSIPSVVDQSVETNGTYGDFGRRGRTETRLNTSRPHF